MTGRWNGQTVSRESHYIGALLRLFWTLPRKFILVTRCQVRAACFLRVEASQKATGFLSLCHVSISAQIGFPPETNEINWGHASPQLDDSKN